MTPRQAQAFEVIRDELAATGIAPTYEEIADRIGVSSKGNIARLVDRLVIDGKLVRAKAGARQLRLPDAPDLIVVPTQALQAELVRRGAALGAFRVPHASLSNKNCAVDHCRSTVEVGHLFCRPHWFATPFPVREALKAAHTTGDLEAYQRALGRAHLAFRRMGGVAS